MDNPLVGLFVLTLLLSAGILPFGSSSVPVEEIPQPTLTLELPARVDSAARYSG